MSDIADELQNYDIPERILGLILQAIQEKIEEAYLRGLRDAQGGG